MCETFFIKRQIKFFSLDGTADVVKMSLANDDILVFFLLFPFFDIKLSR